MQIPPRGGRFKNFQLARKGSQWESKQAVPQTDTGGLGENPKVIERQILKELGKKSTRNFGRWVARCKTRVATKVY